MGWTPCEGEHSWVPILTWVGRYKCSLCFVIGEKPRVVQGKGTWGQRVSGIIPYRCPKCKGPTTKRSHPCPKCRPPGLEDVGDVILGDFLTKSHYGIRGHQLDKDKPQALNHTHAEMHIPETHRSVHVRSDGAKVTTVETIEHRLCPDVTELSRATAQFVVLRRTYVPRERELCPSGDRVYSGFGGGWRFLVRRLGADPETITYTRHCCYTTDATKPATVVGHVAKELV